MPEVGDKIRIIFMNDIRGADYIGREGVVTSVSIDPWGDTRIAGTWGMPLYPSAGDEFEILSA